MADLVREGVSEHLAGRHVVDRRELTRRALALAGRFRSGCRDFAEHHDAHLDEAFNSGRSSSTRLPSTPCQPRHTATGS